MTLQDIFDALSTGELSQLSIGGKPAGVINDTNKSKLLPHINLGLGALFKRFRLKEGNLMLQLVPDKLIYDLTSSYAESNIESVSTPKYIKDLGSTFKDDLIKVEQVFTEKGYELPVNDVVQRYSVATPKTKQIVVPKEIVAKANDLDEDLKTDTLKIVYRASHKKLTMDDDWGDVFEENADLELPDAYMEALLYFVASRINNPIGMTNEFHAGNSYMMKYEQECMRLETENLQMDITPTNTRAYRNGWV